MSVKAITCRFEEGLYTSISRIAEEQHQSMNFCISQALQMYCDCYYMKEKSSIITDEFVQVMRSQFQLLEHRLNNRSNQLLSSVAIQQFIISKVLAESLDISPDALDYYRKQAVEFMKENNRVFSLKEMIE